MESLGWHTGITILVCGYLAGWDIIFRVAPNWMTLPAIVVGSYMGGIETLSFSVVIWVLMVFAQFPGGDCKGAAAMAAWVPPMVFLPALAGTFIATLVIMDSGWYNLYRVAHRWAWLAGLTLALTISSICARLIGT